MAISSSLATKAGAAGTITAGSGLVGTYYAWDHITLYAVEREVISKNVKLTVGTPTGETTKKITASVATDSNPNLEAEHKWACEIKIDSTAAEDNSYSNLGTHIQSHLQISDQTPEKAQNYNKKLLVKACAKDRETKEDKNVKGRLTIKKLDSKFTFKDHPYLDFLLENSLYEVEKKVIDENVALSVEIQSPSKKIKVKTTGTGWGEDSENYWECEITTPNITPDIKQASVESRLKNKKILVQKCSDKRADTPTSKKVKTTLDLSKLTDASTEEAFLKKLFNEK